METWLKDWKEKPWIFGKELKICGNYMTMVYGRQGEWEEWNRMPSEVFFEDVEKWLRGGGLPLDGSQGRRESEGERWLEALKP